MKPIDYTDVYNKYENKWVAFKSDPPNSTEVVGSGNTLKKAISEAQKRGYQNPVVMKLPSLKYTYAL